MNHPLNDKVIRGGVSALLILALLFGLSWPILTTQLAVPENPITQDNIQSINAITLGENSGIEDVENIQSDSDRVVPNGQSEQIQGRPEDHTGEDTPQNKPKDPLEPDITQEDPNTSDSKSEPEETKPIEDEGDQMEDGVSGSDGNQEVELDLGLVLTWYKYGTEPKTVVCAPDGSTNRTIRDSQLQNDELRYDLSFTGTHAANATVTGVAFGIANTVGESVDPSGVVDLMIPEGLGYRKYSFLVTADVEVLDTQGKKQVQQVEFTVVIHYKAGMDLDLELQWQRDGEPAMFLCGANTQINQTVKSANLMDGIFHYSLALKGENAQSATLLQAEYTTASGQTGTLTPAGGELALTTPEGSKTETYIITATAQYIDETGDMTQVYFTIQIHYEDDLDLNLQFVWYRNGLTGQIVQCDFNKQTEVTIKRNQLTGGNLAYDLKLTGSNSEGAKILSAQLVSSGSSTNLAVPNGSCYLTLPDTQNANQYTIVVQTQVQQGDHVRVVEFTIALTYAADLTLQLSYTLQEAEGVQTYTITCENNKTRQTEIVYDDQLTNGMLPYTMSLVGVEASSASITSVMLYQSGSGKSVVYQSNGEASLMLADGQVGENTFTVTAADTEGNTYVFKINIPYKHKGQNTVQIAINLEDGATVTNETEITLAVTAWSENDAGEKTYITATGVDTELTVMLDGVVCGATGLGSGHAQQYTLIPQNPEQGDQNEHTLRIYAEDKYGNSGVKEIKLIGLRSQTGHVKGTATIYIDLTVLGLGVYGPIAYDILTDEPASYVVAKAVWGYDAGIPYGTAKETFGWADGKYSGTLDTGFYLRSLSDGSDMSAKATYYTGPWTANAEETLAAIDTQFGKGSGMATLWRCIYRNGITIGTPGGAYVGEFDYTGGSGWLYSVGGGNYYPGDAMSSYYLQDGEVLVLRYSLAQGWDVGGGNTGYGSTVGYCVSAMNGTFTINHQMEKIEDPENGALSYVCRCCGLEEECAHENAQYKDKGDDTHSKFCADCNQYISDPEEHAWQYAADPETDTHTKTCQQCQLTQTEAHNWTEQSNTATCTEGGIAASSCPECGAAREEESMPKGHQMDNTVYHNAQEHWQKCQVCQTEIDGSRGIHSFQYDDMEADWICNGCGLLHDFDGCGNDDLTLVVSTCQQVSYHCPHCNQNLARSGTFEEYHNYVNGTCTVCGKPDPALPPQEEEPEPEPEAQPSTPPEEQLPSETSDEMEETT